MSNNYFTDLRMERISVDSLKLDARNPRHHSDLQIAQIARSIQTFGFNVPVLVGADNYVLAGHGRILAARKIGWTTVPTIRITHLTTAEARAFSIADNRLTENSTWDDRLLGEIFRDLAAMDLDFSLDVTGFSIGEIDFRIGQVSSPSIADADPDDAIAEAPEEDAAVTERGDVWQLGKHRIICGDATEIAPYEVLMQGARAQMVFTDPPYNVPIDGHVGGKGQIHHREFAMGSGEMTSPQFSHFLLTIFLLLARFSTRSALHFICMDWRHLPELLTAGNQVYSELKNLCVWVKSSAGMGSLYRSQHELIFVYKHGKSPHRNNVQLGQFGRNRTNVWNYPSPSAFGRKGEEGSLLALHPTVKPVALVADAILDCSAPNEIVLDSFLGSGTTLIAAERTHRVCYGIEIDPVYVEVAIRRWQRHCGGHAVHVQTGKRYDALAAERTEVKHG